MAVWNFENAAHLLRRAGFGGTSEEIQAFLDGHDSVADAVDDLLNFPAKKSKPPKGGSDFDKAVFKQKLWWLKTMLKAKTPKDALREKLVLFMHNHLCSGYSAQPEPAYMAVQNGLFRSYAAGNFRELVRDFNRDPANLYYLNGIENHATNDGVHVAVNENFGRELLELFTVGISEFAADGTNDPLKPNYDESDVHQLARAVSGWVEVVKDVGVWHEDAWDGGQYDDDGDDLPDDITIFGVTNNNFQIGADVAGTSNDVLKLIFEREDDEGNPQAAMFVCRKLWTWFAYPAPAPNLKALLASFAAIFEANNYEMRPVLSAMFNHDEFYSDRAKSRTVKNPVDYMVGAYRALGVKSSGKPFKDSSTEPVDMLERMGMELFEPPNVAGWPGGQRWITTGTLVNRLDFARRIAESEAGQSALNLSTFLPIGSAAADPGLVVDAIIARVGLDGSQGGVALTTVQRDALLAFITNSGAKATLDLTDESTNDSRQYVRGTIALVLQSAEAQVF